MAEFQKKRNGKSNIWHSPLVLFILLCIVLLFMYNMIGLVEKVRDSTKKREVVQAQINDMNKSKISLESNISKLQNDAGIEQTIRDKYQLVKPGEKMVVIVDPNQAVNP